MKSNILWIVLALFVFTFSFVLACGDDDDDDDSSDDDDAGTENDDDATEDDDVNDDDDSEDDDDTDDDDSGDDDDDTGDDDDDDTTFDNRWGTVQVSEGYASSNYAALTYYNNVAASFYDPDDGSGWYDEPDESAGSCDRYHYDSSTVNGYSFLDGGVITVTGASISPITLTAAAGRFGYIYTADYDSLLVSNLFDHGDLISADTAGNGSLPAFSAEVTAPAEIQINQPSGFDSLSSLPASDWTVAWNQSNGDMLNLTITTSVGTDTQTILCQLDDADGEVTVPGSLMEDLHSNPSLLSVTLSRTRLARDSEDDKDFDLMAMTSRNRSYIVVK